MRIFNALTSWLLWLGCLYIWACGVLISIVNPPTAERIDVHEDIVLMFRIISLFTLTVALILYFVRYRVWYKKRPSVGLGYWAVTVLYYLCVAALLMCVLSPYFPSRVIDIYFVAGLLVGILLIIISFPLLPAKSTPNGTLA